MFGSGLIELIIGLILIYFLFSLLTSGINELAEQFLHRRAKFLESGIVDILGPWARKFYQHPLIQALHPEQGRPQTLPPPGASPPVPPKFGPSYIPSRTFSRALLSLVAARGHRSSSLWPPASASRRPVSSRFELTLNCFG